MLGVRGTNGHLPQLAIGRVSARSNNDIKIYLQKLIEYERERECTREDRLWTKHAAHLANGHEAIETAQYVLHLEGYKSKFESVNYGGKVVGSYDYTGYPDAPSNAAFTQNMNDGLAVLAFVGHSTETNINFDFREPEDYNNIAQYPFIFAGSSYEYSHPHAIGEDNFFVLISLVKIDNSFLYKVIKMLLFTFS